MDRPAWSPRAPLWPWRDFLTTDERAEIEAGDQAMAEAKRINRGRQLIVNRAIQRAKYHLRAPEGGSDG